LFKIAKKNKHLFLFKLILFRILLLVLNYIKIKVTQKSSYFNKVIKNKKKIKALRNYKHHETKKEKHKIKSILLKTDRYNNPFRKKKVQFNLENNEIKTYYLSNDEKIDKRLHYCFIQKKKKLLYI